MSIRVRGTGMLFAADIEDFRVWFLRRRKRHRLRKDTAKR
jgi:hypothetical protein